MKKKIIASSPTKEGILKLISAYYMGTLYEIIEDGQLRRLSDNKILTSVIVVEKNKRFQFVVK